MSTSLYEETLPHCDYEFAEKTLGETREIREKYLSDIIQWLDECPHINASRDTTILLHFLRGSKFRLDIAKRRIETIRSERVEWFADRNPFDSKIVKLLDLGLFLPLDGKDVNNSQVFIVRTGLHNSRQHKQNDVFKTMKMVLDVAISLDESISIYGAVAIFDMKGVTWHHALQMTPTVIKRAVHCWENYSCQVKKLEFINAPTHINIILDIFRQFMSEKLRNRLLVTRGLSTIDACLPSDLGGDGKSYAELTDYWKKKTQSQAAWFVEQDRFKSTI